MSARPPRSVLHAPEIRVEASASQVAVPVGGVHEPRVELVRDGDVVSAIDVHCTCGERIRILCEYQ